MTNADHVVPKVSERAAQPVRWRTFGIFATALVLWCWGYYVTEEQSPLGQPVRVWARGFGHKYQRTVRESETNIALFHLSHAVLDAYSYDMLKKGRTLPVAWPELIRDTGDYAGSHMAGTLTRAYPFLAKPVDPWGRPWVFRLEETWRSSVDDLVDLKFTFGSLGPDGQECDSQEVNYDTRRRTCDDLLITKRFLGVPLSSVPSGIPVNSR